MVLPEVFFLGKSVDSYTTVYTQASIIMSAGCLTNISVSGLGFINSLVWKGSFNGVILGVGLPAIMVGG